MSKDGNDITEPLADACRRDELGVVREFMTKVGDKWSIMLVVTLARTPKGRARFSELQRMLDGISQRVLTTTLRALERDGIVFREAFAEVPPRVEYELTALGLGLLVPMRQLVEWIEGNWPSIEESRERFDGRVRPM